MFYLLTLIIKPENSLIRKTNIFGCDRFFMHCGIDKFCITCRKLITTTELQYYVNLGANFNPNKFDNLSIQFERESIINIQSFFSVIGWLVFFWLIHNVDFCLVNFRVWKWFATSKTHFVKWLDCLLLLLIKSKNLFPV